MGKHEAPPTELLSIVGMGDLKSTQVPLKASNSNKYLRSNKN